MNLDPGALVMAGHDPIAMIERFSDRIVLSHVRDATAGSPQRSGEETALGMGEVNLVGVLAVLGAAGYAGPHIIRRTQTRTPREDIAFARDTMRRLLPG